MHISFYSFNRKENVFKPGGAKKTYCYLKKKKNYAISYDDSDKKNMVR